MPKYVVKHNSAQFGNAPYGNYSVLHFGLKTNAKGGLLNANDATPIKQNDVIVLGDLPTGMRLENATLFVSEGLATSSKAKLGYVFKDGSTGGEDDFFGTDLDVAAKGRVAAKNSKTVTLSKDALLVLTVTSGANNKAADVSVSVYGEICGGL